MFDASDGAVPETIRGQALEAMANEPSQLKKHSLNDGKQSVGHDVSVSDVNDVFSSLRPSVVVGERDTSQSVPMNVQAEAAFNKVSGLQERMGHEFEKKFNSEYLSRIFPWALKYSCGGADYENLFGDSDDLPNYIQEHTPRCLPRDLRVSLLESGC